MQIDLINNVLFVALAVPIGIICGVIPNIGTFMALLLMYPLLYNYPFDVIITFYAVAYMCQFFSNSVVAIWAGVAGDTTTLPILSERENIISQNLQGYALKRTAQASLISSLCSLFLLFVFTNYAQSALSLFVSSIANALIMVVILLVAISYTTNKKWQNLVLIFIGILLGLVGYHPEYSTTFLTFNQASLYNGIPLLSFILGLYAIPVMYDAFIEGYCNFKNQESFENTFKIPKTFVNCGSVSRGTIIGFMVGLIPLIGTASSSNVAYFIENKINPGAKKTLERMTASESANNAAGISVLAPLLILGIAIVPSEMLLVSVLNDRAWKISDITLNTYIWLVSSIIASLGFVYIICVTYAGVLMNMLKKYQIFVVIGFAMLLIYGTWIQGQQTLSGGYQVSVLLISSILGFVLRHFTWNPIPCIIAFVVASVSLPIFSRVYQLLYYSILTF